MSRNQNPVLLWTELITAKKQLEANIDAKIEEIDREITARSIQVDRLRERILNEESIIALLREEKRDIQAPLALKSSEPDPATVKMETPIGLEMAQEVADAQASGQSESLQSTRNRFQQPGQSKSSPDRTTTTASGYSISGRREQPSHPRSQNYFPSTALARARERRREEREYEDELTCNHGERNDKGSLVSFGEPKRISFGFPEDNPTCDTSTSLPTLTHSTFHEASRSSNGDSGEKTMAELKEEFFIGLAAFRGQYIKSDSSFAALTGAAGSATDPVPPELVGGSRSKKRRMGLDFEAKKRAKTKQNRKATY
ncbi:MAG: hypothetical protein Q9216_003127 [Gyalolechia sp. 2 TL-2023]